METADGVAQLAAAGEHCEECVELWLAYNVAIMDADTAGRALAQEDLAAHMAVVLHADSRPGLDRYLDDRPFAHPDAIDCLSLPASGPIQSGTRLPKCTAEMRTPSEAIGVALLAGGESAHSQWEGGEVVCDLGVHEGEHACFVGDRNGPLSTLWLFWTDAGFRLDWRASCEAAPVVNDWACWLYRDHPSCHTSEIEDLEREAMLANLRKRDAKR